MMFGTLIQYHDDFFDKYGDPRIKGYPLMDGPLPTIAICVVYVYVATTLGPRIMKNRRPFELKKPILIYNILQIIYSMFNVIQGFRYGMLTSQSLLCLNEEPEDELVVLIIRQCWLFYVSRLCEMTDTIFFILRKKMNQVSTLHVVHHTIMPITVWIGAKFLPAGGQPTHWAFWNSIVHVIMYSYYLLAGLGPHMQKYLWWKKYLTILQLVQFVAIWVHATQSIFSNCNYNRWFSAYISAHGVLFFYMFLQFYRQAYSQGSKSKTEVFAKTVNVCAPSASDGGAFYERSEKQQQEKSK